MQCPTSYYFFFFFGFIFLLTLLHSSLLQEVGLPSQVARFTKVGYNFKYYGFSICNSLIHA